MIIATMWFLRACGFLPFPVYLHPGAGHSGARRRMCGQSQDVSTSHLVTAATPSARIIIISIARTQAVMKAVRKCAPVPIILLFVNILFIRNYSEKETGDGIKHTKKCVCDRTYIFDSS